MNSHKRRIGKRKEERDKAIRALITEPHRRWSLAEIRAIVDEYEAAEYGTKHLVLAKYEVALAHIRYWRGRIKRAERSRRRKAR